MKTQWEIDHEAAMKYREAQALKYLRPDWIEAFFEKRFALVSVSRINDFIGSLRGLGSEKEEEGRDSGGEDKQTKQDGAGKVVPTKSKSK
jgi:hypothetical protein